MTSLLLTSALFAGACASKTATAPVESGTSAQVGPATSAPTRLATETQQQQLIETAFKVASAIPIDPHGVERANMQALVVKSCIKHGWLDRATKYSEQIVGWRKGECLALVAQSYAKNGNEVKAHELVNQALVIAANDETFGKDRVNGEAARAFIAMGDEKQAFAVIGRSSQDEIGKVQIARTDNVTPAQLDAQADMFDKGIATQNFDLSQTGINGYLVWLVRVIEDQPRRARALQALDAAIPGLPLDLQITTLADLAERLGTNGYPELAQLQLDRARKLLSSSNFLAEDAAPIGIPVAQVRAHLGDRTGAIDQLRQIDEQYRAHEAEIVNLRRGISLRALAEGYAQFGDYQSALDRYSAALEAGILNPNSRPRAEDLTATCISMADSGVSPTVSQLRRIEEISGMLSDPW